MVEFRGFGAHVRLRGGATGGVACASVAAVGTFAFPHEGADERGVDGSCAVGWGPEGVLEALWEGGSLLEHSCSGHGYCLADDQEGGGQGQPREAEGEKKV
mmetsp:Transcript_19679/g.39609  ORF Transcript_19679/g.39609 Transcript_19679/m.39609 type:complete len:101 (+) Transcript_19679:242-544(+)